MYCCRTIQCYSHQLIRCLVPCAALVLTWLVFTLSASRPAKELARVRTRSTKTFRRSRQLVGVTLLLSLRSAPSGAMKLLAPSLARSIAEAFNMVCCLDRNGKPDDSPQDKKQKVATTLLRDELLGRILLHRSPHRPPRFWDQFRVVEILPHMKLVSRASRPGLTVGFLRILCDGLCTAQRFPRRSHPLQDLITQVFLRSLQYGIVVMGFIDAFVYAHHQHRQSIENPGNFGDYMKGRVRFMTAITPAYVHAYQVTCLTRHMPAVERLNLRLPKPKARYPHLSNIRITTRERGNDFQGWAIYTDGGTRLVNGETLAGWDAVARSHHPPRLISLFSGARTDSNNTAEMSAVIEALSFLGLHGPVARDANSCIFLTPTCCWCFFGHDSSPHTCPAGTCVPTVDAESPALRFCHATRVRPYRESGK